MEKQIHGFLARIYAKQGWSVATAKRFTKFYNEQCGPACTFNTSTLFKNPSRHITEKEMTITKRWWGIGQDPETLEEIAKTYGVTRERIRQIKEKALRKFIHPSRSNIIRRNLEEMGFSFRPLKRTHKPFSWAAFALPLSYSVILFLTL